MILTASFSWCHILIGQLLGINWLEVDKGLSCWSESFVFFLNSQLLYQVNLSVYLSSAVSSVYLALLIQSDYFSFQVVCPASCPLKLYVCMFVIHTLRLPLHYPDKGLNLENDQYLSPYFGVLYVLHLFNSFLLL